MARTARPNYGLTDEDFTVTVINGPQGDWLEGAACSGMDPELWFPKANRPLDEDTAKVCESCPVRMQCLGWSLQFTSGYGEHSLSGWYGGRSQKQRQILRRKLGIRGGVSVGGVRMADSVTAPTGSRRCGRGHVVPEGVRQCNTCHNMRRRIRHAMSRDNQT